MTDGEPASRHESAASALSPVQSGLRFVIEIAALVCWAGVGWAVASGAARWILAAAFVVVAAGLWGAFRVPGDLSAGGQAPVSVPGLVRLVLEIDILVGGGVVALVLWNRALGGTVVVASVVHYAATRRRVRWLVDQRSTILHG